MASFVARHFDLFGGTMNSGITGLCGKQSCPSAISNWRVSSRFLSSSVLARILKAAIMPSFDLSDAGGFIFIFTWAEPRDRSRSI